MGALNIVGTCSIVVVSCQECIIDKSMKPRIPSVNDIFRKWRSETSHVGKVKILFQRNAWILLHVLALCVLCALRSNFNIVTMPTCDVLLRHYGKTMLYTEVYALHTLIYYILLILSIVHCSLYCCCLSCPLFTIDCTRWSALLYLDIPCCALFKPASLVS